MDKRLRELSWRRRLTGPEEAELRTWLSANPEAQADWEAEAGLNESLSRLPDVPVPGNFTARVLQAVEREAAAELRGREGKWLIWPWRRWLPRVAFALVVVGAGFVSYQKVDAANRRKLAESVAVVSSWSSLPSPDILKDFDAIQALNATPPPDEELLFVFQ
jgi:anti-sigma factor RsiW